MEEVPLLETLIAVLQLTMGTVFAAPPPSAARQIQLASLLTAVVAPEQQPLVQPMA
jgi:hypothetical protein